MIAPVNNIALSYVVAFYGFGVLSLVALAGFHYYFEIPYSHLTIDPVVALKGDPFTGILSNIGVILWSGTAAVCLLMVLLQNGNAEKRKVKLFFLMSFLITLFLLIDDFFLLHDVVLPDIFKLRERHIYITYATLVLAFIFFNIKTFLKTPYFILLIAFSFFALSLFTDWAVRYVTIPESYLVEDGTKFLGIVNWCMYFTYISYMEIKGKLRI